MYRYLVVDIENQVYPFSDLKLAIQEVDQYRANKDFANLYDMHQCKPGMSVFETVPVYSTE